MTSSALGRPVAKSRTTVPGVATPASAQTALKWFLSEMRSSIAGLSCGTTTLVPSVSRFADNDCT